MTTSPVVVTVRLPPDLVARLDERAETDQRSRNWLIRRAVESSLSHEPGNDVISVFSTANAPVGSLVPMPTIVRQDLEPSSTTVVAEPAKRPVRQPDTRMSVDAPDIATVPEPTSVPTPEGRGLRPTVDENVSSTVFEIERR